MNLPLRAAVAVVATFTAASFVVHAVVLRPRLFPAGAGVTLSGDAILTELAELPVVGFARVPDVRGPLGRPVTVLTVAPGSPADRAGIQVGAVVTAVQTDDSAVDIGPTFPSDPVAVVRMWRELYRSRPTGPIVLTVIDTPGAEPRRVSLERPPVWETSADVFAAWLEQHSAPLVKHLAYGMAGLLVVVLGARGLTAGLIALAFLLMAATDDGPVMGAEWLLPGGVALVPFSWMLMAVSFPIICASILHFPKRAPILERYPWLLAAVSSISAPLGVMGAITTAFLLGADAAAPAVSWLATHPWAFNTCFAIALTTNLVLLLEAVRRYHLNPDRVERRRIQAVLVTAVPGMLGYFATTAIPLMAASLGAPFRWPEPLAGLFQFFILLSAFGMAYAVAVRRAMSPRTVIRQGVQYALARKTLWLLTTLPGLLLVLSLIRQRDQPLVEIVQGRPLFYIGSLVLIALGVRYRDEARKWIDRQFFRSEYDAREILLGLASRVPNETDPRELIALVLNDVDSAIHPSSIAVLAESGGAFDVIESRQVQPLPLPANSGLAQLLQWSDAPLEVFLEDPRSTVGRLPASDREWLAGASAALLVPVFAGSGPDRPLIGFIVLGRKRSEETFTSEDRKLLAGIAAQMGLALDLSRLRRQAASTPRGAMLSPGATAATIAPPVVDVGATVEGKYRVDALIGRGGMGAVYRARDLRLDRDVAIKVVRGDLVAGAEAQERFTREARLAARLQHPAIVTVYDYGTLPDGAAYLVMEYVRGEDLRARLGRGTLDQRETVQLLAAVAEGVDAAHRAHILHRDLKPENVLLPEHGGGPKVLDFGVAKLMPSGGGAGTITQHATIVGTPAYMAPEQIRGGAVDGRADVYSLGVMAYEMLTGRLPFGGGSFVDVAVRQTSDVPALDGLPLPERLAGVLRGALSVAPEQRPATAMAFAAELRRAVS